MPMNGLRMGDWVAEIEPALDTAIYASGDVLFNPIEVEGATMSNGTSVIQSITVIDWDDQGGAFDLVFFDDDGVDLGTVNVAVALPAGQAHKFVGRVSVGSGDYTDLGTVQEATLTGVGLVIRPTNGTSVWVGGVSRDTKTYPIAQLNIKIGFLRG